MSLWPSMAYIIPTPPEHANSSSLGAASLGAATFSSTRRFQGIVFFLHSRLKNGVNRVLSAYGIKEKLASRVATNENIRSIFLRTSIPHPVAGRLSQWVRDEGREPGLPRTDRRGYPVAS